MTTISRKKPGVAFWATVVLVVALAYPVSFGPACWKKKGRKKGPGRPGQDILECPLFSLAFGPACWITSRLDRGSDLVPIIYRPFTWGMSEQSDTTIGSVIMWYAEVGAAENWQWGALWEASETPGSEHVRCEWVEIFPTPPP